VESDVLPVGCTAIPVEIEKKGTEHGGRDGKGASERRKEGKVASAQKGREEVFEPRDGCCKKKTIAIFWSSLKN
jgi:hypothetical protein